MHTIRNLAIPMNCPYKIAIVGPESSGKSTLGLELAHHFKEPIVTEFAREYLEKGDGSYEQFELDIMLQKQLEMEQIQFSQAIKFLFCDTNTIAFKIWSDFKYSSCSDYILNQCDQVEYDLHLLLKDDLPYEEDPLRENPNPRERKVLFDLFEKELSDRKLPYSIVDGFGTDRIKNALTILQDRFSN